MMSFNSDFLKGERVVMKLRKQLYQAIIVREISFYDESKTGDLISRLSSDCVRFLINPEK